MLSKKILIAVVALVLVSATGLMAKTDWHGKFWGDNEGEWKGTLYDSEVDPPIFKGAWTDGTDKGEIFAELNYEGHGIYRIVKGIIYDDNGHEIGIWAGYFDTNIKPGYAEGKWSIEELGFEGKWQGKRILP